LTWEAASGYSDIVGGIGEVTFNLERTSLTIRNVIAMAAKDPALAKWGAFKNSRADIDHGRFNFHFPFAYVLIFVSYRPNFLLISY
jgi:hypothetical protein